MQCNNTKPLLDLLSDGALEPKDCALVLGHLETCSECRFEWEELEHLRARIREEKERPLNTEDVMKRISGAISDEELRQKRRHIFKVAPTLAATCLLIGILIFSAQEPLSNEPVTQLASIESLVDTMDRNNSIEQLSVKDKSTIGSKVGYDIKYLKLAAWRMEGCGVYKPTNNQAMARFDFVSKQGGSQRLSCYQAKAGSIRTAGGQAKTIGDKNVTVGSRGQYQFALWSQNGRDYLFLTKMPQSALEEVVRGA